ncbi:hypothetical protein [Lactococcus garvieae]|uniref:hypothetical protein n=1 Tax=Lactococcus garvieae TaxID=1363 RepID=UPI00398E6F6C
MRARDELLEIGIENALSKIKVSEFDEILDLSQYVNSKNLGKITSGAILYHIGYAKAAERDSIEALSSNDISELSQIVGVDVDILLSAVDKIISNRKLQRIRFKRILKWYIAHDKATQALSIVNTKARIAFINRPYPIKLKYKLVKGGRQ